MVKKTDLEQTTLGEIVAEISEAELASLSHIIPDRLVCAWLDHQMIGMAEARSDPDARRKIGARFAAAGITPSCLSRSLGITVDDAN